MRNVILVSCLVLGVLALAFLVVTGMAVGGGNWGQFEGEVVTNWGKDKRDMKLEAPFTYVDPRGKKWAAPAGSVINGASIPQPLWSIIGGPFEGPYRNASVVHDVYCDSKSEPSKDVHFMFYEACRCGGVEERKAKLLYFAVSQFGPHWEKAIQSNGSVGATIIDVEPPQFTNQDAERIKDYFDRNNPDIEDIPELRIPGVN